MPNNENPWVSELLTWHGQDRGGVRVPFHSTMGKPLRVVVDTPIIRKLRLLAADLIAGVPGTPRWIFLVGGPGNGKSEAVEAFVRQLDALCNADGELVDSVRREFSASVVTPRRVDVFGTALKGTGIEKTIRRLILIQDASAVDAPDTNAEDPLIDDLADLITSPAEQEPVFLCCANRGLIARALSAIQTRERLNWLDSPEITELLTQLLTATGLGPDALATDRPQCWPLRFDKRFAAWPLDLETIIQTDTEASPLSRMLSAAADERNWSGNGCCDDCTSRELCPFHLNAKTLRDDKARETLLSLLRHGEMATAQRWNFRDAFSLCAELIVGQRDDFGTDSGGSPCSWVHERADQITHGGQPAAKLSAVWELTFHLYQQALFPVWPDTDDEIDLRNVSQSPLTEAVIEIFSQKRRSEGTQVRQLLAGTFSLRLDPARATPPGCSSLLRSVEDEFGQSVKQGSVTFRERLNPLMEQLLELMASAESDWTEDVRDLRKARATIEFLRITCSTLVKRLLGVRRGEYLNVEGLVEYEALLADSQKLGNVVHPLRSILAPTGNFGGSLVRVFGQPLPEPDKDILVTSALGNVLPRAATTSTESCPAHDVPWLEVEKQRIPLTFDLYSALQAHSKGVTIASFAPHNRAAIDKVRNAIAAILSRDKVGMLGGGVSVNIGALGCLTPRPDGTLEFRINGDK